MNTRTIHVTESDMLRLRDPISSARSGDDRDRPYLAVLESELDRAVVLSPDQIAPNNDEPGILRQVGCQKCVLADGELPVSHQTVHAPIRRNHVRLATLC